MRSRKAALNVILSFSQQIVSVICGLIIPRLIIGTFGSEINGLLSSITQFLSYIILLEAGAGGVTRAALYKPLAEGDRDKISSVVKASERFFRNVAFIFIGYLALICVLYPLIIMRDFGFLFTSSLIAIIGISTFVQYYFGITYQVLLQADQRQYISSSFQVFTLILNAVAVVVLVLLGAPVHIVKAGSAVVLVLRPILLNLYVNKRYQINKSSPPDNEAIKQRWDGLWHHIAFFLHKNTDIVILTLFENIMEVSVYSVYYSIVSGVENLTITFSLGLEAAFGNMIARNEKQALKKNFHMFEFTAFSITTVLFTSTALLIIPFVSVYTKGLTDVNYLRPTFAYILVAAEALYCIRMPYNSVVLAAGHYRQTRNGAFAEALINIALSIILVNFFGIIGVAIGTFCAMLFRTVQYAVYLSSNIIEGCLKSFIKHIIITVGEIAAIILIVKALPFGEINSYAQWVVFAMVVVLISTIITAAAGVLFYREDVRHLLLHLRNLLKARKNKA
jgi:O-antigen/teichoic acid export membrane protein